MSQPTPPVGMPVAVVPRSAGIFTGRVFPHALWGLPSMTRAVPAGVPTMRTVSELDK